ncbi:hypothetical protein PUN28_008716 [Cardiocondyla obscurior]|uniref:Uncharacterized protein n=1 Tax=Cardiocondyla obscurior TaxID=286306 RepID=A0AAW2G0K8_9HYME
MSGDSFVSMFLDVPWVERVAGKKNFVERVGSSVVAPETFLRHPLQGDNFVERVRNSVVAPETLLRHSLQSNVHFFRHRHSRRHSRRHFSRTESSFLSLRRS